MTQPYPLTFRPQLFAKVWGGDRLASYGKSVKPGERIGESWEVADLGATTPGGGGGGAARSEIANGPLAGKTLHDALAAWGPGLLGKARATPDGNFPLLVKFLDAREHLSVQVHPSPAYAAAHPGAHLKTESWYVLDASPIDGHPPVIYKGVRAGVTRADFERALREPGAHGAGVVELLERVPAIPGECHTLPSGTVHALGAGVLVAEVQTPSDTTFRVYDWAREYGRAGRELHVEPSLECIAWTPAPPTSRAPDAKAASVMIRLAQNEFYTLVEMRVPTGAAVPMRGCAVLLVIQGQLAMDWAGGHLRLERGGAVLLPAGVQVTARAAEPTRILAAALGTGAA